MIAPSSGSHRTRVSPVMVWPAAAVAGLVPRSAAAYVITPLSLVTVPLLPAIILVELTVLLALARRWLRVNVGLWRVLGAVSLANLATSLLGTVVPIHRYAAENVLWLGVAFAVSLAVEWGTWLALLGALRPHKARLVAVCVAANLGTYVPLAVMFALGGISLPGRRPRCGRRRPGPCPPGSSARCLAGGAGGPDRPDADGQRR